MEFERNWVEIKDNKDPDENDIHFEDTNQIVEEIRQMKLKKI